MITKEAIQKIGNEAKQAVCEDHKYAPKVTVYQADSDTFPKVEVQVGKVLFALNNSGAAVYYPDLDPSAKHLSQKVDAEVLTEEAARKMLANAIGLGVTLNTMEAHGIALAGQQPTRVVGSTKDGNIEFNHSPAFQCANQTILRVSTPLTDNDKSLATTSYWKNLPEIYCNPNLIENMAETLDIATKAILTSMEVKPEEKIVETPLQKLEKEANAALKVALQNVGEGRVKIAELPAVTTGKNLTGEELKAVLTAGTATSHIKYSLVINELETVQNGDIKGSPIEALELGKVVGPIWEKITEELKTIGQEKFPSIDLGM